MDLHGPRIGARKVLRRHDFRWLLLSFGISRLGDFLYTVALIVYIFDRTGSAAWVAAATLARFVPYVVVSPLGGLIADRYHRRTVMMASELTSMATMAAITVTAAMSGPAVAVIALVAVAACAATLYQACGIAMVQDVLPENELAAGNSLLSTVDNIAFVAGPAGGALLLLLGAPAIAFGVNTASFVLSALFLSRIRTRSDTSGEQPRAAHALRAGLDAFLGNRAVLVLVGCLVAGNVVYGLELVVLVLVSSELLGTGAEGVGWLLAASGIGGVAGAAISARLATTSRARTTTAVLVLLSGLPLASLAATRLPVIAYALLVVEGIAIICLDVLVSTATQRLVASPLLGRVAGLTMSLTSVGTAAGTLLAPVLVDLLGLVPTLVLVGVVPVTIAAAALALVPGLNAELDRTRLAAGPASGAAAKAPTAQPRRHRGSGATRGQRGARARTGRHRAAPPGRSGRRPAHPRRGHARGGPRERRHHPAGQQSHRAGLRRGDRTRAPHPAHRHRDRRLRCRTLARAGVGLPRRRQRQRLRGAARRHRQPHRCAARVVAPVHGAPPATSAGVRPVTGGPAAGSRPPWSSRKGGYTSVIRAT